ncbi:DUF5028 domain-containing protein [Emergencia sp. 1XD21-10]|uniref:DUF5028 domain-containing protein n=1 Tax=Emergencia sp. 1XD21-10 TaxID=2304569 RepID=UPI00137B8D1E|nr:DUF5028 domain-containing protein [Emergencia sp. 1XD21-10]NCE98232.1 DUF5028 domain-containing protein [Emergencia sp. 1XD21-10]
MKKVVIVLLAVVLAIGGGLRVYTVNRSVDIPVIQMFSKGEEVPVGKDFFSYADEDMDGYIVTVLDAELLSATDFLKTYHAEAKAQLLGIFTDYIYTVHVRIANRDNPHTGEKGISLQQYMLCGTDYILSLEESCFLIANPKMPGSSFSMKKGTSMELLLTFDVMSQTVSVKHLTEDAPKLLISQYPHQKMIELD